MLCRAHLWVGLFALLAFLGTGLLMRTHEPPLAQLDDARRLLYRSRHIYLLGAACANLLAGVYLRPLPAFAGHLQRVGSTALWIAPVFALAGFFMDPAADQLTAARWGKYSAFALFGGTVVHFLAAACAARSQARNKSLH